MELVGIVCHVPELLLLYEVILIILIMFEICSCSILVFPVFFVIWRFYSSLWIVVICVSSSCCFPLHCDDLLSHLCPVNCSTHHVLPLCRIICFLLSTFPRTVHIFIAGSSLNLILQGKHFNLSPCSLGSTFQWFCNCGAGPAVHCILSTNSAAADSLFVLMLLQNCFSFHCASQSQKKVYDRWNDEQVQTWLSRHAGDDIQLELETATVHSL